MYADLNFPIVCATRLAIIQRQCEYLSMAVFGDVSPDVRKLNSLSLSKSVDPQNSTTMIAQQLISLLPDSRPLPLIVLLMFCLNLQTKTGSIAISTLTWTMYRIATLSFFDFSA